MGVLKDLEVDLPGPRWHFWFPPAAILDFAGVEAILPKKFFMHIWLLNLKKTCAAKKSSPTKKIWSKKIFGSQFLERKKSLVI